MSCCLCCGKTLRIENEYGWHSSCIKSFFGTTKFPDIDVSKDVLNQIAIDNTNKGFTVPGVQKKLSLHLVSDDAPRLTLVNYPTGYILKPQTEQYSHLPEAEHLIMSMAKVTGINTVPFAMVKMGNEFAYITRRIDRVRTKGSKPKVKKLAMEERIQYI